MLLIKKKFSASIIKLLLNKGVDVNQMYNNKTIDAGLKKYNGDFRCCDLNKKDNDCKEEEADKDVIVRINRLDNGDLKLTKKKYWIRNKKYSDDETKWRVHNPNLCGWTDLMKNCHRYQERLKDVEIYNGDYKNMLKYDSKDTLFYFDPPWTVDATGKKGNKCYSGFVELNDFYNSIKDLKGYIMISYNDHPDILEKFKDWRIEYVNTVYTQKKSGGKKVQDLLIFNFDKDYNKLI